MRTPLAAVTMACTLAACAATGNFDRELATRDLATTEAAPTESEVLALLSAIHGQRIGQSWRLGMSLGPPCDEWIERALELAPENPRAWLARGTSLHSRPALFGGDEEEALDAFGRAAELFDRGAAADAMRPTWGRADAHAWRGQVLRALGRDDEALAEYHRALEIAPDFGWVRDGLLPSLERKLAATAP